MFYINKFLAWFYGLDLIPSSEILNNPNLLKKMHTKLGHNSFKHPIGLDSGFDLGGTVEIKIVI